MKFNIVVSINNHHLIGENNKLIIHSKKDLRNFQKITTNQYPEKKQNIIIMGYNTWISIPEDKRPLKKRMNIILTRHHHIEETETVKSFQNLSEAFQWSQNKGIIFIIGGTQIFNECCKPEYCQYLDTIYLTQFNDNYHPRNTTHSFPLQLLNDMECISKSEIHNEICDRPHLEGESDNIYERFFKDPIVKSVSFTFDIYQKKNNINHDEKQYLDLLKKIIHQNNIIQSRNSKVYSLFGEKMEFDLQKGFPLLTTKQIGYKTILRELLWFIKGSTSNQELNNQNVHIWDMNSSREFLDSRNLDYEEGDLGPVYGFQWRHFGTEYESCHSDYSGEGIDQLKNIIHLIKTEPTSRRIILNSWNVSDIDKMALPPCHVMCQFNVNTNNNTLNCQLYQRSGDMFLGVPFNIASYSLLTYIIAKITGYSPGKFIHILGDAHIYESHLNAVNEQIERVPYSFPELLISDELSDIDNIKEDYFIMKNYNSYPKITAPMIA